MGLQISSTPALIGINNIKPIQHIEQPKGEQSIQQVPAKMHIDRELPKVVIDQYQCFAERGLKNSGDLARDNAQWAQKIAFEYIGRIAAEGDAFGRIEDGQSAYDVLADIASSNAWPQIDYNIGFIPKSRPKIDVTGHLSVSWELGKAIHDYKPQKAIHDYQTGKVEIYLRQKNSISIQYIDEKV